MNDFLKGEAVLIKTDAVDQKTQLPLNNKKGTIVLVSAKEILVNLMLKGKSRTLPFAKNELTKILV